MPKSTEHKNIIFITGDLTVNWHLAQNPTNTSDSKPGNARICGEYGGAALLRRMVTGVGDKLQTSGNKGFQIISPNIPTEPPTIGDENYHHTFSLWSKFKNDNQEAWRMTKPLGHTISLELTPETSVTKAELPDGELPVDLIVLYDTNLGFRDQPAFWRPALTRPGSHPWVLLHMAAPVAQGPLWEELIDHHSDRLIVHLAVDDLRHTEVQISRELSWERTAQDVYWELVHNPRINALSRCAHTVISFSTAGAILFSRVSGMSTPHRCRLVFDPEVMEGLWEAAHPGEMIGTEICMVAGLASAILHDPDKPDLIQGIQSGLAGLRDLHQGGYQDLDATGTAPQLGFPVEQVASLIADEPAHFPVVDVQDPVRFLRKPLPLAEKPPQNAFWTILTDRYQEGLGQLAEQIVFTGPEVALQDVPLGRFGDLLTVDRREIEAFRSLRALVAEYCSHLPQKHPLSIAVFGPPGAGKSFGITQVAKALLPSRIQVIEFNLSQFDGISDLWDAMHQVRDVGLSGQIPLVFWDEFDTPLGGKRLGWLRFFQAPMQDGRFQEEQLTHPLGNAIFVFAGGTSSNLRSFGKDLDVTDFRAAKGPDFISRLKGYVNVLGPNRQAKEGEAGLDADPYFIIRRAVILRSLFQRNVPHLFAIENSQERLRIDRGVLRGFLQVQRYKHGVRSMEAIIAMSQLAGAHRYERSCLPAETQLDLHVDGQDFLALVQQMDLDGELLEILAAATHNIFLEGLSEADRLTHSAAVPYEDLPEIDKEQNRSNVRDIPRKLALAGYVMIPARSNEPPFKFPGEHLEKLARLEHARWIEVKQADGWRYAPETDKARRLHNCLVPWEELPEIEKQKDINLVREIPFILARAGYAIVKTAEGS